jgi:hypothetical protein
MSQGDDGWNGISTPTAYRVGREARTPGGRKIALHGDKPADRTTSNAAYGEVALLESLSPQAIAGKVQSGCPPCLINGTKGQYLMPTQN